MFGIKRLYTFVLKTFFPLLLATFSVCLFILLMQFLWQYVNDMVGKGVDITVLGQLFFYAALSFVPMALPLSVLLASLMTFGNLGEHLELLAMKASGISLIRIMKPMIFVMIALMGVSFVFQNNILPSAQVKMTTILYSLRQKSPELSIPEGYFYKEITGYNVYVRQKDKKTGMLQNMMIYDYSNGFENAMVIVADSGKLNTSEDKQSLMLTLYDGEAFENLTKQKRRSVTENVPYRRETFRLRTILIPQETDFNMVDESLMGSRNIGKNVKELSHFADSVEYQLDSLVKHTTPIFINRTYANAFKQGSLGVTNSQQKVDSLLLAGFYPYYKAQTPSFRLEMLEAAKEKVRNMKSEYTATMYGQTSLQKEIRSHKMELHKKFALSFACLCFFFIGGPLGAIVRKGGLGTPVVLSVLIFLSYYTIDTFGLKMAKQGVWSVWEGMWLSSAVLIVLGVFFTYKAINDSVIMNPDSWKIYLQQLWKKIKRKK